jgi:hypothetical protein
LLALAAAVFTNAAFVVLRHAPEDRHGPSPILSVVELVAGAAMASGVVAAVQGYGEPSRSPLLLPSGLLVALGVAGLRLEVMSRHASAGEMP